LRPNPSKKNLMRCPALLLSPSWLPSLPGVAVRPPALCGSASLPVAESQAPSSPECHPSSPARHQPSPIGGRRCSSWLPGLASSVAAARGTVPSQRPAVNGPGLQASLESSTAPAVSGPGLTVGAYMLLFDTPCIPIHVVYVFIYPKLTYFCALTG
jgi:hypothetical protein